ncbi:Pao retrotransposon peptidase [Teladorsagia circumcincta]|uniref:Pao retrotransposon peptidase n=1 Tax=Teladorsagia circumcincta TaxID=45464 RepID=A0A2G9T5M5_TELCI|nr:Pao retrotransposon peptidase [Teladorsagia circumcincta]
MTTKSTAEAIHLYETSQAVFEMKMNLREFISNDEKLKRQIPKKDLSEITTQKILGILWNSIQDELILTCKYPPKEKITKGSVSEQIASIYDPLGWMTPITLRGKRFLQHLWKCDYSWDEILSREHQQQWKEILQDVDDFQCKFNRRITQINESVGLVVFSDASSIGMATCAYITSNNGSAAVAGKSKLPSLKETPTIPKMELNALTMAVRLINRSKLDFITSTEYIYRRVSAKPSS